MKINPIHLLFILCTSISTSFAQQISYSPDIPIKTLRIDIERVGGGTVSEMLADVEYIPLQVVDNQMLKDVSNTTAIIDRHIGVFNKINSKPFLFIYSLGDGALIKAVDVIKSSKLPTSEPHYTLKTWDDTFILLTGDYVVYIDTDGTDVRLGKRNNFGFLDSARIGKSVWRHVAYTDSALEKIALTINHVPTITYRSNLPDGQIPTRKHTYFSPLYAPENERYFCPDNHFKIFELSEEKITKVYDFIFPQKNIIDTSKVYESPQEFIQYMNHLSESESQLIFGLEHIIRHGRYLVFSTMHSLYAYDVDTDETMDLGEIIPDASNDFIPLFYHPIVHSDGEFLHTVILPDQVRRAERKCKEENHPMREEYRRLKNHPNPILVRFKLKE